MREIKHQLPMALVDPGGAPRTAPIQFYSFLYSFWEYWPKYQIGALKFWSWRSLLDRKLITDCLSTVKLSY